LAIIIPIIGMWATGFDFQNSGIVCHELFNGSTLQQCSRIKDGASIAFIIVAFMTFLAASLSSLVIWENGTFDYRYFTDRSNAKYNILKERSDKKLEPIRQEIKKKEKEKSEKIQMEQQQQKLAKKKEQKVAATKVK
jgi:large-conductance mechanosensitive channel